MAQEGIARARGLTEELYGALRLDERALYLRQSGKTGIGAPADTARAAARLERWKTQSPFSTGDWFQKRLRADGLTEDDLLSLIGLAPETYAGLANPPPDWVRALERAYLEDGEPEGHPEFERRVDEGTNGFLWVAYPLIADGLRKFRAGVDRLAPGGLPFDAQSAERLVLANLPAALRTLLARVMALELNVARIQGTLRGETAEERFRSFCERLRQPDVRLSLAREYPVLFRDLHRATGNWVDASVELLERLSRDWELIRGELWGGADPGALESIAGGAGDTHRRGRSVAVLEFSSGRKLVYKPRSQSGDAHFGALLGWMNGAGFRNQFRVPKIIDRGSYGWSEFVEHRACATREELERFYHRLGAYLAVFHLLRTTDLHFENLIAAGEFPIPVDLETLMHPELKEKDDPATLAWQRSVLRVLLLPQRIYGSDREEGVDLSGLGGRAGQYYPSGSPSWEGKGTDGMRLVRDRPVPMETGRNRPKLEEQDAILGDHADDFVNGFEEAYRLLAARRAELGGILRNFANDEMRYIARPTAVYGTLLSAGHHPDMLRNALDRDQLFDRLWLGAAQLPHLVRLISAELEDLRGGDVPAFTCRPDSRDLWTSRGERIPEFFEQTAMDEAVEGLAVWGEADLARQVELICDSIASAGEGAAGAATLRKAQRADSRDAVALARTIGDQLCRDALENEAYASWLAVTPVGAREACCSPKPMGSDFYSGLPGCSFFLAYLARVTGDTSYKRIASKSLNLARRLMERSRAAGPLFGSVGGFSGLGGTIYGLAHLAALWDDASLLEEARALAAEVPSLVETDQALDVGGGSAGAIAALAVLDHISPGDGLLEIAVSCGDRLLSQQKKQPAGAAWVSPIAAHAPLTGFLHGAAGMAWALLKLAAWSGKERFRAAAESAIQYERSTFSEVKANWPDFRKGSIGPVGGEFQSGFMAAWCHGAAGIGLARIDSLRYADDSTTRQEIEAALNTTIGFGFGGTHCLCHGDLGNLELLFQAGQRVDDFWWDRHGQALGAGTLAAIAENGSRCGTPHGLETPGLLVGLAGIGYGLLRLARPEQVPSVLTLAPPA